MKANARTDLALYVVDSHDQILVKTRSTVLCAKNTKHMSLEKISTVVLRQTET